MEPISVGVVIGKIGSYLAPKIGKFSIERWSRVRAERFCEAFYLGVAHDLESELDSERTHARLNEILQDELKSEILFDAYRSVCLSKTRTLGPRIIGFLTATLVSENRIADDTEEQVFRAAEQFSDRDFSGFLQEFKIQSEKQQWNCPVFGGSTNMEVPLGEVRINNHDPNAESFDISPLNLVRTIGFWALKAEQLGLIRGEITQKNFNDARAGFDVSETIYKSTVTYEVSCKLLANLTERCLQTNWGE